MSTRALWLAAGLALIASDARAGGVLGEVFPDGLPVPFAAVLERLREVAGPENVATALVPLGRSLQRYGAHPDYFGSPRVLVAVTGDRAGPGEARLADRLFIGYQPAAEVVEAMSYDEAAGRFEFVEVVRYPERVAPQPAEGRVCFACHQGEGPIFARPLWTETNANPAVAARLAPLGRQFHGAPVVQSVDGLAAFDGATDRAARIEVANRLWQGCPDPACRAALLAAAVRFALGGGDAAAGPAARAFEAAAAARWPEGIAGISPDLPNRDPLPQGPDLETTGRLNPETPREPLVLWHPEDGFAGAAREIAGELAPGDLAWIGGLARRRGGPSQAVELACATERVAGERRFDCAAGDVRLRGFVDGGGAGRIEALALPGLPALAGFVDLAPRLPDGRRVADLVVDDDGVRFRLVDDLGPLADGLAARADDAPALGTGPFRRRAVLALIGDVMEAADG